jgi:hypothetical protein
MFVKLFDELRKSRFIFNAIVVEITNITMKILVQNLTKIIASRLIVLRASVKVDKSLGDRSPISN